MRYKFRRYIETDQPVSWELKYNENQSKHKRLGELSSFDQTCWQEAMFFPHKESKKLANKQRNYRKEYKLPHN